MENITQVPTTGWIVIGLISILTFILASSKGIRINAGDKSISVGKTVDKKLEAFRTDIEKKDLARSHDEELRKKMFRESNLIDDKLKADMRRIVRSLTDDIYSVFQAHVKCEFPAGRVEDIIKSELFQRIDENHMRDKLASSEREGYLYDISHDIEKDYRAFRIAIGRSLCGEGYPEWHEISQGISIILFNWAEKTSEAICTRTEEKISYYKSFRENFLLESYKVSSVDDPISKNKNYLRALGREIA